MEKSVLARTHSKLALVSVNDGSVRAASFSQLSTEGYVMSVAFSPDGKRLVSASEEQEKSKDGR